jgi:hypothetical protein
MGSANGRAIKQRAKIRSRLNSSALVGNGGVTPPTGQNVPSDFHSPDFTMRFLLPALPASLVLALADAPAAYAALVPALPNRPREESKVIAWRRDIHERPEQGTRRQARPPTISIQELLAKIKPNSHSQ